MWHTHFVFTFLTMMTISRVIKYVYILCIYISPPNFYVLSPDIHLFNYFLRQSIKDNISRVCALNFFRKKNILATGVTLACASLIPYTGRSAHQTRWSGWLLCLGFNEVTQFLSKSEVLVRIFFTNNHTFSSIFT